MQQSIICEPTLQQNSNDISWSDLDEENLVNYMQQSIICEPNLEQNSNDISEMVTMVCRASYAMYLDSATFGIRGCTLWCADSGYKGYYLDTRMFRWMMISHLKRK